MTVRVQTADFDVARELAALRAGHLEVGAVAAFIGTVRDVNDGRAVAGLTLEHYPGMTEKALAAIVDEAKSRWDILDALVVHRVGPLAPADQIVLVGVRRLGQETERAHFARLALAITVRRKVHGSDCHWQWGGPFHEMNVSVRKPIGEDHLLSRRCPTARS